MIVTVAAFAASLLFAFTTQAPPRTLAACGLSGMLSWGVYLMLGSSHPVAAAFASALAAGALSEVLARWQREPAAVFISAGVLPLVPGVTAYRGMLALVQGQAAPAMAMLTRALFIAGAVAAGVALPPALFRTLLRRR